MAEKILDPEYVDLEKTRVRFKIVHENGLENVAELTVPKGKQKGVNKYWDMIVEQFDIEEMRQRRNRIETERRQRERHHAEKMKNQGEINRLRHLFDSKSKVFELPFISEADVEVKSAVRRAPTFEILTFIVNDLTKKFMEENDMDYNDFLDYLEDLEDEKEEMKNDG